MAADIPQLQVAIVGAGIAGLTAAIALRKHPKINVTLYDKATELKEIGASIALGPNGLRTLERLGLNDVISDDIAFRGPSNVPMIYRHWKTNEIIGTDQFKDVDEHLHRTARYHRAHLHQALLKHVPGEIIHPEKKISSVDANLEGVKLKFKDGTTATADLLIGADGIRSGVRTSFVPDFPLKWSGWTAFRSVFDLSLTDEIPDLIVDSTHWWGPDTMFFASRLGKNLFTVVGGLQVDPNDPDAIIKSASWDQKADVHLLRDKYADWNPVVKRLTEVTPDIRFYPNLSCSSPLQTWVFNSRVTLIGDAAHAHGGAHATGGSLAIDDAYALYLSLLSVFPATSMQKPGTAELEKALRLYEATRKPHTDKLLGRVHIANEGKIRRLRTGKLESDEELKDRARKGTDTTWLHEHDLVKAFEEVLRKNEDTAR